MNPLGFTEAWFQLGIVTAEQVQIWEAEFANGDDPNSEHYRWRAFHVYLKANKPNATQMESLYELGESDADPEIGSAMMVMIIERQDCPRFLARRAASCERKNVAKIAQRLLEGRWYADA